MSSNIVDALGRIPLCANLMATLTRAATYAGAQQHREVALEHMLLALTEDPDAALVMSISNVEIDTLKGDISSHIGRMDASVTQSPISELRIASELKDILQAAAAAAEGRRNEIDGAIVLAAIVGEGKSASAGLLRAHGMTFETAIRALQQAAALQAQRAEAAAQQASAPGAAAAVQTQPSPLVEPARPAPEAEPRAPIAHHNQTSAEDILASARQRVQGRIAPGLSDMRPAAKDEPQAAGAAEAASKSDALAAAEAATEAEFERISAESTRQDTQARTVHDASAATEIETPTYVPQPAPAAQRPSPPGAVRPRPPEPQQPTATEMAGRPPQHLPPAPSRAVQPPFDRAMAPVDGQSAEPGQGTMPPPPAPRPPVLQRQPAPAQGAGGQSPVAGPNPNQPPLPPGRQPLNGQPTGAAAQRAPHAGGAPGQPQPPRPALPGFPGMDQRPAFPPAGTAPRGGPPPPPLPGGPPPAVPPQGGPFPPQHRAAGPPAPQPAAAPPPQAYGRPPGPQQMPDAPRRPIHSSVSIGQLIENVPRVMRVAIPVMVEVRIARAEVKAVADGMQGGGPPRRHEINVTKAMSVRLRAPEGGFIIEAASPETQWIDGVLGPMTDDYASWRWSVTPLERGHRRLQVVVAARTASDGLSAETALPDQIVDVRVKTNYGRAFKRLGGWAVAAVAGGLLAHFGEGLPLVAMQLVQLVVK